MFTPPNIPFDRTTRHTTAEIEKFLVALGTKWGFAAKQQVQLPALFSPKAIVDVVWSDRETGEHLIYFEVESGNDRPYANLSKVLYDPRPPSAWPRRLLFVGHRRARKLHLDRLLRAGKIGPAAFQVTGSVQLTQDTTWKSELTEAIERELSLTVRPDDSPLSPVDVFNEFRPLLDSGCTLGAAAMIYRDARLLIRRAKDNQRLRTHAFTVTLAATELLQKIGHLPEAKSFLLPLREWRESLPTKFARELANRLDRIEAKLVLQDATLPNLNHSTDLFKRIVTVQQGADRLPGLWRLSLLRILAGGDVSADEVLGDYQTEIEASGSARTFDARGNVGFARSLVHISRREFDAARASIRESLPYDFNWSDPGRSQEASTPLKGLLLAILTLLVTAAEDPRVKEQAHALRSDIEGLLSQYGLTPRFEGMAELALAAEAGGLRAPTWEFGMRPLTLYTALGANCDSMILSKLLSLTNDALHLFALDPLSIR